MVVIVGMRDDAGRGVVAAVADGGVRWTTAADAGIIPYAMKTNVVTYNAMLAILL
ncbi:MAG: hypothetical protein ACI4NZ_01230 [Candidatus Enterousia sp.]